MAGRNEKKNITKSKIVNYIINNKITSKAELAQNLSLSMPTVLSNVNELIDRNMVKVNRLRKRLTHTGATWQRRHTHE